MGCLFEDIQELDKLQCVYWNNDGCREPEINCGNSDALCNEMIWKQRDRIKQLETELEKAREYQDKMMDKADEFSDKCEQLENENSVFNESISEYDKAVNALQNQVEKLEAENKVLAEQNSAMNDTTVKQYHRIEKLQNE